MNRMWLAAAGIVALSVGCESKPNMVDIQGTITVAGKPMDKIHVEFWPETNGPRSIGMSDASGKFTLTSDDGLTKGAVIGKHKVVLRDLGIMTDKFLGRAGEGVDMTEGRKPRIANLYEEPHKSPLSVEVSAEKNTLELIAEPYAGP